MQPKKGRLWLNDGWCVRLRPERPNDVWAHDFVPDRTHDGRKFRMLCVVDEFTREALAIRVDRRLSSAEVLETLAELMLERGVPEHIRLDNGPEFVAQSVRDWIKAMGAKSAYVEPGSPWENKYLVSFNSKLRDELLDREVISSLREAQILIEGWRRHYNAVRPHSALRWTPPAPEVSLPKTQVWPATTLAHYAPTTTIDPGAVIRVELRPRRQRSWHRVHLVCDARLVGEHRCALALHRAWQADAERHLRSVQRSNAG
jgi:putative transposase